MTDLIILFWKVLILFGLSWYICTIFIVGFKGFKNIKTMLGVGNNEKN
ncbi:hypothetical protein ACLSZY_04780 [Avibacterium volantium]